MMKKPVTLLVIGAGDRGTYFGKYAVHYPDKAKVVGVAEPRQYQREFLKKQNDIPDENVAEDWKEFISREKFADAVIIATPDALHAEIAVAFAKKGYHLFLEKPMANSEEDCRRVAKTAKDNSSIVSVGHVLRYNFITQKIKEIINRGAIGDIASIQHLEPVGYWHYAHSYVRGNWHDEKKSSSFLLAKSCHDLDWISYIVGRKCKAVSSFGALKYFREENKPDGAAEYCYECPHEPECPYSAKKIYFGFLKKGKTDWPVSVVTPNPTEESLTEALRTGPYGRCVYQGVNDVVDHQVVNMFFEDNITASFTVTAFTEEAYRKTTIFGTRGELYCDGDIIRVYDFLTDKTEIFDLKVMAEDSKLSGHGGGDFEWIKSFISAVAENDPSKILSGAEETLESHLMVFAAERARKENCVVNL